MQGIIKLFKSFPRILFIFLLFTVISACNGVTPTSPTINSFTASPPSITSGESSTLNWSVTDADTLSLNQGIGTVTGTAMTVSPTTTTTYTLTASNSAGSNTATTSVTVTEEEVGYGIIQVDSTPQGAKIYLDGEDTGKQTPADLTSIEAGNHTITLTNYLFNDWESVITLASGEIKNLNATLEEATIQKITINDCIDASVEAANPNMNFGNLDFLVVGANSLPSNKVLTYIQFDLNNFPEGGVITEVKMEIYCFKYSTIGCAISHRIYQVTENWQEDQITWNNKPPVGIVEQGSSVLLSVSMIINNFIDIDITDLCRSWLDQSEVNHGLRINDYWEMCTVNYYSSEYTKKDKRPKLVVSYYIP